MIYNLCLKLFQKLVFTNPLNTFPLLGKANGIKEADCCRLTIYLPTQCNLILFNYHNLARHNADGTNNNKILDCYIKYEIMRAI